MSINHHTNRSLTFRYTRNQEMNSIVSKTEIVSLAVIQYFSFQGSKKDLTDTAILSGSNTEIQQRHLWGILNFLKNLWCLYKSRIADSEDTILLVEIQPTKSEDRASGIIIH